MPQGAIRPDRAGQFEEVLQSTNLLRVEAAALVARRHGEDVSDIVGPEGPLMKEQKKALGFGRSLAEFIEPVRGEKDAVEADSDR